MAYTIHTQKIIEFEFLMSLEVLLQGLINNICRFAIGPIEITYKILLYYFLMECCNEAVIEFIYIWLILLTF
jgi:hypothetical protein